ncbi:MAG: ubiquinol-cytochrome c reductase iron-sulfur subunit, partial [Deltaproteobacteria bacterium]|nr:ubiquinol-cytochrome c reductase iron-sulfur subunit [Deltaproteobacteria bacterium]
MPLIDDLDADVPSDELTRRKVLGLLAGSAFAVAGAGAGIEVVRFMRPNVLFEPATKVPLGPPAAIVAGTLLVLPDQKLYVARTVEGFFAMSSVCTHLGCITRYEPEQKRIFCPCHGSKFDLDGRVVGGPAPKPLQRNHLTIEDGQLVVDTRKK